MKKKYNFIVAVYSGIVFGPCTDKARCKYGW